MCGGGEGLLRTETCWQPKKQKEARKNQQESLKERERERQTGERVLAKYPNPDKSSRKPGNKTDNSAEKTNPNTYLQHERQFPFLLAQRSFRARGCVYRWVGGWE